MRDDIYGGLRNALEHGTSLEQAIKSFTNAGYPEIEVREAAKALEGGSSLLAVQQASPQAPRIPSLPPQSSTRPLRQQQPVRTTFEMPKQHHRPSILVIVLSLILILSIASFVFSIIFKKEIAVFLARLITG